VPIDDRLILKTEEGQRGEDRMAEELDSDSMRGCAGREDELGSGVIWSCICNPSQAAKIVHTDPSLAEVT
jgi:hypothetical protein